MISKTLQHFRVEHEDNGVTTVWIDVAERSMNVFSGTVIEELESVVADLKQDLNESALSAVVFRSAKPSGFFAGADVQQIAELNTSAEVQAVISRGQNLFTEIEQLAVPTIAAIHGPCLGGGLEFALACRYRIAMNSSATRLGLPEVQLGLIPGWGGTQRLPKLVGLVGALPLILLGKKLTAGAALRLQLVDAVSSEAEWDAFVDTFAQDATKRTRSPLPWKKRILRIATDSAIGRWLVLRAATKQTARDAKNYPALPAALRAVRAAFESGDGFAVEREEFVKLVKSSTSRNLLNLFLWREQARSLDVLSKGQSTEGPLESRLQVPDTATVDSGKRTQLIQGSATKSDSAAVRTIGVIGAGAMGAGIGQLAGLKGFNVVFKELTPELAAAGMARVTGLLDDMVKKRRLSATERDEVLSRVSATDNFEGLADCDLVIEAVVEKMDVKQAVFAALDDVLKPHALIVSNTSALSVTEMATATRRPGQVAGLHFFNPVHRMDLVEVVSCNATSDETVAALLKLVKKLGKTPVVTSDSPGFLVNRVLFPYIGEAVRMVLEGHDCRELDREVKRFGMPMGPIELIDHVGLDVAWHVATTLEDVLPESRAVIGLLGQMVARGWIGRKGGRGFYMYDSGRKGAAADLGSLISTNGDESPASSTDGTRLHQPPADTKPAGDSDPAVHPGVGAFLSDGMNDTQRRLIYPMINEVGFCLQEGVIAEAWMADLAMILGTGFAPFRGGPMTLADTIGHSTLINNLHVLTARHGERFKVSAWLVERRTGVADAVVNVE